MVKNVVICSAGKGTRLGLNLPKCLAEVNGKTIIEHQLEMLKDVPNVYIVLGYKANLVIPIVKSIRPDVYIYMNENYETTNVVDSLRIGMQDIKESFIYIDGDLLISYDSFTDFSNNCKEDNIVCVCNSKTDDAVFVEANSHFEIVNFQRSPKTNLEWSGAAYMDLEFIKQQLLVKSNCYIYQLFTDDLPMMAYNIDCHEIDTPHDLENAKSWLSKVKRK